MPEVVRFDVKPITYRHLMHMQIMLYSVSRQLGEQLTPYYIKMSVATVFFYIFTWKV